MSPARRCSSMRIASPSAAGAALLLCACQVGPNFQAPVPSSAAGYAPGGLPASIAPDQRLVAGGDVPARWWEAYGSAELNALMDQVIKASPDIESAKAALRSAHELYLAQRGAALPTVDAGYNLTGQRL